MCSAGSGCDRVKIGVGKKTKTHTKCSHEEIVNLFVKTEAKKNLVRVNKKTDKHEEGSEVVKDDEENKSTKDKIAGTHETEGTNVGEQYLNNTSEWIYDNEKISFVNLNMAKVQKEIVKQNKIGWPSVYTTENTTCPKCGNTNISNSMMHQGSTQAYLLTREIC